MRWFERYVVSNIRAVRIGSQRHNITIGTRSGRWFIALNAI